MKKLILFTTLHLLLVGITIAQNLKISGIILDENNLPLSGANIYLEGTVFGTASDLDGYFEINSIPQGIFTLKISMIGFLEKDISIQISDKSINLEVLNLQPSPILIQPILTTASKYGQNFQDVAASITNVSAQEITQRNAITVEDAIKYTSGINLNDGQVNIRGSSGYSRGVGSRVLMLVDGVPYITGDTQGLVSEALTVNEIDKIEIVKGPGSALYGSGAVGGVINVLTKPIHDEGITFIKVYGGLYDDPYYSKWRWSERSRYLNGQKISYSKKIDDFGFRLGIARDEDDSYRKNDWKKRVNVAGKLQYDLSPFDRITFSGNYMDQRRANFLYWKNLENALTPPDDQRKDYVNAIRTYFNTAYQKVFGDERYIKTNLLWFHNHFDDFIGNEGHSSTSNFFHSEIQYNQKLGQHFFSIGINPTYSDVSSNLFGTHQSFGAALFIQDEIRFSEKFSATIGTRFDYSDIDDIGNDQQLNPKLGLVWKPLKGSSLRLSAGTGFRAPSIAEAFTSTTAGGLTVIPNPQLKSEKSNSVEIGWNQIFNEYLATDIAIFTNNYDNLIEGRVQADANIQFQNVTEAHINGFEIGLFGQFLNKGLIYRLGYTYVDPRDVKEKRYLTYRPRHLLYGTASVNVFFADLAFDYRLISAYDRIDDTFALVIADAEERNDAHILDMRISKDFKLNNFPISVSLQINNALQYNYVDLVGSIGPIRQFILTLQAEI